MMDCLLQSVKLGTDESAEDEEWKSVYSTKAKTDYSLCIFAP